MPASKFNKLAGARVVVLGGTSGIGFAVAEGSIESGASVVIASSSAEKVEKAIARLREAYPDHQSSISGQKCDLSNAETVEANLRSLLDLATKDGKKVNHIVNTAGGHRLKVALEDMAPKHLTQYDMKTATFFVLAKLASTYMEPGPQASLINTTGTMLYKPEADFATNVGWDGSIESGAKSLAVLLAPLRVNVVSPGAIDTELMQGLNTDPKARDTFYEYFRQGNLLKTVGRPEDVAEAYLYLMKDRFITGHTIMADGGRLLK